MPAMASATAPRMNPPTIAWFALRPMARLSVRPAAGQEAADLGVATLVQERGRVSRRGDRPGLVVEEHGVRRDGEDTGQLVGDHHHRGAQAVAQLEDEVVEAPGAERI